MTPAQKIELRRSEVRERLNEISGLEGDAFTDEVRGEADILQSEYRDLEVRHRAAVVAGDVAAEAGTTTPAGSATEDRERLELRQRASVGRFLLAALRGRSPDGAEAELQAEAGVEGIPLELWDTATEARAAETRADAPTGAPGTVGVNLDRIRPAVFAHAVLPAPRRRDATRRQSGDLRVRHDQHVPDGGLAGQGRRRGGQRGGVHGHLGDA